MGFPDSSVGKESAWHAGDPSSIPGLGRSSGEGNGNPLQYSCLENTMDRGAWRAIVHGVSRVGHNLETKPPTTTTTTDNSSTTVIKAFTELLLYAKDKLSHSKYYFLYPTNNSVR